MNSVINYLMIFLKFKHQNGSPYKPAGISHVLCGVAISELPALPPNVEDRSVLWEKRAEPAHHPAVKWGRQPAGPWSKSRVRAGAESPQPGAWGMGEGGAGAPPGTPSTPSGEDFHPRRATRLEKVTS